MGFSGQEQWNGLPCPPPGDLSHPGIESMSLVSPALWADSLPAEKPGNASDMQNHFQRLPKTEEIKTVYHI